MKSQAWMFAAMTFTAVAAGCQPVATAAPLPVHELDWGNAVAPPARDNPTISRSVRSFAGGDDDWADVTGYRQWQYIVIHHSATDSGSASEFDVEHRDRGWDGLGYHFVIDNGSGGPDGRVEVGPRWRTQKWGAHTGKTPGNEYNNHGIGICLVGDFTHHMPSPAQLASLRRLVSYHIAKYDISPENVIGHRDAPGASTACPGNYLHTYIHSGNFRTLVTK